jgi:hypothetical protein
VAVAVVAVPVAVEEGELEALSLVALVEAVSHLAAATARGRHLVPEQELGWVLERESVQLRLFRRQRIASRRGASWSTG